MTEKIKNMRVRDNASKLVFGDPTMCAQFLQGYSNIDLLKNVRPEDIEDITERFIPLFQESKDSDTVKKIHLPGQDTCLYLIAIIEHQTDVHYDMAYRMLQYMMFVLEDYRKEEEKKQKGISKTKDFRYPPVLPIVYYEGTSSWTPATNFKDRVALSDVLKPYIPDFEYLLVPLTAYSNEDIIEKGDVLSLIMLVNKLRDSADFKQLKNIPSEYFEHLEQETPEYLLELISRIISALLYHINLPETEVDDFTDRIKRRDIHMMFDCFQGYDIQETRRISREEGENAGKIAGRIASVLELLKDLGEIPDSVEQKIQDEQDEQTLTKWLKLAATSSTMKEFISRMD